MVQFHAIHLFVIRQKRMLNFSWDDTITDCVRPYGGTTQVKVDGPVRPRNGPKRARYNGPVTAPFGHGPVTGPL